MSTAHHPQTDGATEQANHEIEAYLSIFCCNNPETWCSLLPTLEFAYNSKPHTTQKESPFYLQIGYDPKAIPTAYPKTNLPETQDRLLILQEAWKSWSCSWISKTENDGKDNTRIQAIQALW